MRRSTLLLFLLTVAVGTGLFLVKYRVQGLEDQLQGLNKNIATDRQAIHVLKAEWSHLNDPKRLKKLAGRHLDMIPIAVGQVTTRRGLAARLPERADDTVAANESPDSPDPVAESGKAAGKEFRP